MPEELHLPDRGPVFLPAKNPSWMFSIGALKMTQEAIVLPKVLSICAQDLAVSEFGVCRARKMEETYIAKVAFGRK